MNPRRLQREARVSMLMFLLMMGRRMRQIAPRVKARRGGLIDEACLQVRVVAQESLGLGQAVAGGQHRVEVLLDARGAADGREPVRAGERLGRDGFPEPRLFEQAGEIYRDMVLDEIARLPKPDDSILSDASLRAMARFSGFFEAMGGFLFDAWKDRYGQGGKS